MSVPRRFPAVLLSTRNRAGWPIVALAFWVAATPRAGAQTAPSPDQGPITPPAGGTQVNIIGGGNNAPVNPLSPPPSGALERATLQPGWTITPSINLQETYTDNVLEISSPRLSEVYTTINPGVLITGDTQRIQTVINYDPSFLIFPNYPGLNQFDQNGNAYAEIKIIPDTLFLDLRGFAMVQQTPGGYAGPFYATNNAYATQVTSFSISPYVQHRFGDIGTGKLMYSLSDTNFSETGINGVGNYVPSSVQTPSYFFPLNGYMLTNEEQAQFTTGNYFGRVQYQGTADLQQYAGFGFGPNSYQNIYDNEFSYALTRNFWLLGGGGYEDIRYNMSPLILINDAIWDFGFKWKPNADSTIIATYGHKYGLTYPYLNAEYALTARTRINALYTEYLDTAPQAIQNNLANSTVDATGQSLDSQTNAPVVVANPFFALQQGLLKTKLLNLGTSTTYDRDQIGLTFSHESDIVEAAPFGILAFSDRSTMGTISWSHVISDNLNMTPSVQSGTMSFFGPGIPNGTFTDVTGGVTLSYAFSKSLTGTLQYYYMRYFTNFVGGSFVQNMVTVGLTKTFNQ
jgi:uncharacterized protein (PEP-CTERM system associated)